MGGKTSKQKKAVRPQRRKNLQAKKTTFHVLILGDAGIGKSSLLLQFAEGRFPDQFINRLDEEDTRQRVVKVNGVDITLILKDTSGQERFRELTNSFYQGAGGAILCYDVSNAETFNKSKKWLSEIRQYSKSDSIFFFVGNKLDLSRATDESEIKKFSIAEKLTHFECSAKTNTGVEEIFQELAKQLYEGQEEN